MLLESGVITDVDKDTLEMMKKSIVTKPIVNSPMRSAMGTKIDPKQISLLASAAQEYDMVMVLHAAGTGRYEPTGGYSYVDFIIAGETGYFRFGAYEVSRLDESVIDRFMKDTYDRILEAKAQQMMIPVRNRVQWDQGL
jgi:hypothetical protein